MVLKGASHAQTADDATALNAEVMKLYRAGKYAEATEIAKRVLAIREKALGPEHPDVGGSLNNLAALYETQGRYAEAEPLYKLSLAIYNKALGPEHPDVGGLLRRLGPGCRLLAAQHGRDPAPRAARVGRSRGGFIQGIVRERQDLVGEWQAKDKLLMAAKSEEPAKRNATAEKALSDRVRRNNWAGNLPAW